MNTAPLGLRDVQGRAVVDPPQPADLGRRRRRGRAGRDRADRRHRHRPDAHGLRAAAGNQSHTETRPAAARSGSTALTIEGLPGGWTGADRLHPHRREAAGHAGGDLRPARCLYADRAVRNRRMAGPQERQLPAHRQPDRGAQQGLRGGQQRQRRPRVRPEQRRQPVRVGRGRGAASPSWSPRPPTVANRRARRSATTSRSRSASCPATGSRSRAPTRRPASSRSGWWRRTGR